MTTNTTETKHTPVAIEQHGGASYLITPTSNRLVRIEPVSSEGGAMFGELMPRIRDSLNALAGFPDPERDVKALLDAVSMAADLIDGPIADLLTGDSMNDSGAYDVLNLLRAALSRLQPPAAKGTP